MKKKPPSWLKRARNLLNDQFHRGPSLAEIAAAVDVHPVHFASTFRKHFGSSVGEYLRRLRVEFACRRLATSGEPLAEIAVTAGFADQSHLARQFKRAYGTSPGQWRALTRQ